MILALLAATSACGPRPGELAPIEVQPGATAHIDASYPTAAAAVSGADQQASGIQVHLNRAWIEGKNLNAEVCFSLPDASDWTVRSASLAYADVVQDQYGFTLLRFEEPAEGQAGLRCDTLTFVVPPDADLSSAALSISSIGAEPRPGDYCSVYLPKIQQTLLERGVGITLECVDVSGLLTMQIAGKPPEMSQEEAEQIVYSEEFYTLQGPWTFTLSLPQ
jgi:hypothetical protein